MALDFIPCWLAKQTGEHSTQALTKAEWTSIQSIIQRTAPVYSSRGRDAWLRLSLHLSDAGYEAIHTLKIRPSSLVQSITVVITVFGHNGTDLHQNSMDLCDTHIPIHPQNHLVFPSAGSSSVSPHHSMKDTMKFSTEVRDRQPWCIRKHKVMHIHN